MCQRERREKTFRSDFARAPRVFCARARRARRAGLEPDRTLKCAGSGIGVHASWPERQATLGGGHGGDLRLLRSDVSVETLAGRAISARAGEPISRLRARRQVAVVLCLPCLCCVVWCVVCCAAAGLRYQLVASARSSSSARRRSSCSMRSMASERSAGSWPVATVMTYWLRLIWWLAASWSSRSRSSGVILNVRWRVLGRVGVVVVMLPWGWSFLLRLVPRDARHSDRTNAALRIRHRSGPKRPYRA